MLLYTDIACKVNGTTLGGISLVKIVWLSWQSVGSSTRVDDSEGPYVDSGRQDIFWLLLRQDQTTPDTDVGTVPKFKQVLKIRSHGKPGALPS